MAVAAIAAVSLLAGLVAWLAPLPVVLGAGTLVGAVVLAVGAWAVGGRARVVDLSVTLPVVLGAYAGAVTPSVLGLPPVVGLVVGALVGAVAGAGVAVATAGAGALRRALVTLSVAAAAPALAAVWPGGGGEPGFHAVPLVTGGDGGDLVVLAALGAAAVAAAVGAASGPLGARGTVATRAPHASRALGRSPAADAAALGALGGAVLAVGGWIGAVQSGSVVPAAHGLPLAALLVLAASLAGPRWWGAVAAGLLLVGPSVLWPLAPLIGDAPPVLTTGPLALAVLAWHGPLARRATSPARRPAAAPAVGGRVPDLPPGPRAEQPPEPAPADRSPGHAPADRSRPPAPADRSHGLALAVAGFPLADGRRVDLTADPGEIVAVRGRNGLGKSTLLAAIAGEVDDHGTVRLDGADAPRGARARARRGLARTWQRPPDVDGRDLTAATGAPSVGADPAVAQAAAALARHPRLLLLDEAGPLIGTEGLATVLAAARRIGTTVVIVEHDPVPGADRTVDLEEAP